MEARYDNVKETTLSWAERPMPELMRLAWPIVVSMVSYSAMTLVDTLFVSTMGPSALAGVGLGGLVMWGVICFPYGLLQGAKVLVSQAAGAGRTHRYGPLLTAALGWALILSAISVVAGLLMTLAVEPLTATAGAAESMSTYLWIRALGTPLILLFAAEREVRQGLGDSRSPMVASVTANLVNFVLDYLFIIVLELGVSGAAWATVMAGAVELGLLTWVLRRGRPTPGQLRLADLGAIWRLGWPTGLQFFIEMGSFLLLSVMISRYGELDMAAHQITIQLIHFSFMPAVAVGEACAVMTGQAVGAGHMGMVRVVARRAMWMAGVYTGTCGLIFGLGGGSLAAWFTADPRLIAMTCNLLLVAAIFQVFDAGVIVYRGALRGTGDVRFPAVVGILAAWLCTPPSMWLLGYRAGLGALGGWIGLCAEIIAIALILWYRLEHKGWHGAAIRARAAGALAG